jgi:hypothetical protein
MMRVRIEEREEISMIETSNPQNSPLAKMVTSEEAVASEEVEIREAGIVEAALVLVVATMRDLAVEEERMPQDQTTCFLTRISLPCEQAS